MLKFKIFKHKNRLKKEKKKLYMSNVRYTISPAAQFNNNNKDLLSIIYLTFIQSLQYKSEIKKKLIVFANEIMLDSKPKVIF